MRDLLDLVLPAACAGCGALGRLLCARCASALTPTALPGDRFVAADPGVIVGGELVLAIAAFRYGGPLRRSLAALKYGGASRLAFPLAHAAAPALARLLALAGPATLVPVPVHRGRQRMRGYNQAELLARELARDSDLPMSELLVRSRPTTKQHRLDRAARLANLRGAFEARTDVRVTGTALLVDDIITTTATLEACAAVLKRAGIGAVYGFAIAREI